jgi:hypothetical protein
MAAQLIQMATTHNGASSYRHPLPANESLARTNLIDLQCKVLSHSQAFANKHPLTITSKPIHTESALKPLQQQQARYTM